jgi:hypothetical protein
MNRKPKKLLLKGDRDEKVQLVAIYYIVTFILSRSRSLPNLLPCKKLLIELPPKTIPTLFLIPSGAS